MWPAIMECVPCSILLEDPEVRDKVLWQNMQLVEPWENDEVRDDIFAINPTFNPRDRLSSAQQAVSYLLASFLLTSCGALEQKPWCLEKLSSNSSLW